MRSIILAALLAGSVAVPAQAQEAATTFTGARVEGIVGFSQADTPAGNNNGITYGGGAGFDFDLGGLVAGVEAEFAESDINECGVDQDVAGDELCAEIGRDLYAGGRLGARVGTGTLLYGKAGYVRSKLRLDYDDGSPTGTQDFTLDDDLDGGRVGVGLEQMLGRNAYVKAEYRYSNYEQGLEKHGVVGGVGLRF